MYELSETGLENKWECVVGHPGGQEGLEWRMARANEWCNVEKVSHVLPFGDSMDWAHGSHVSRDSELPILPTDSGMCICCSVGCGYKHRAYLTSPGPGHSTFIVLA